MLLEELLLIKVSAISKDLENLQQLMKNSIEVKRNNKKIDTSKSINKFLSKKQKL